MRKKSITTFVGVYAALCIGYGVAGRGLEKPGEDALAVTSAAEETDQEFGEVPSGDEAFYISEHSSAAGPSLSNGEAYVEPKPTLEEYLSKLRCGGCRRNCLLLYPGCMNGARKASQAETQYDQMYQS